MNRYAQKFLVFGALSAFFVLSVVPSAFAQNIATTTRMRTRRPFSTSTLNVQYDEEGAFWAGGGNSAWQSAIAALGNSPNLILRIPVLLGVQPADLDDTWGDARANGRVHEGTDILAPRGSYVVSPTNAVVTGIGYGALGGNYVYTTNAGGERYYFAHLDSVAKGLVNGQVLQPGDLIGYVGNTGNAAGGPTHLHFGIYTMGGAINPFPRLTLAFSLQERISALTKIIATADSPTTTAKTAIAEYKSTFTLAQSENIILSALEIQALVNQAANLTNGITRDLTIGSQGDDVTWLQEFLIKTNSGPAAQALASIGATGYFGTYTRSALAEYQAAVGIAPSVGYFGPITRARVT